MEAYDELVQRPHMVRTQRKHEGRPPSPRVRPPPHMMLFYESDSEGADSQSDDDGPIPGAVFYRAPRPASPPLDLDCDCRLPAFCSKCTCGCDNVCCLYHHEGESEHRKLMKKWTIEEQILTRERAAGCT